MKPSITFALYAWSPLTCAFRLDHRSQQQKRRQRPPNLEFMKSSTVKRLSSWNCADTARVHCWPTRVAAPPRTSSTRAPGSGGSWLCVLKPPTPAARCRNDGPTGSLGGPSACRPRTLDEVRVAAEVEAARPTPATHARAHAFVGTLFFACELAPAHTRDFMAARRAALGRDHRSALALAQLRAFRPPTRAPPSSPTSTRFVAAGPAHRCSSNAPLQELLLGELDAAAVAERAVAARAADPDYTLTEDEVKRHAARGTSAARGPLEALLAAIVDGDPSIRKYGMEKDYGAVGDVADARTCARAAPSACWRCCCSTSRRCPSTSSTRTAFELLDCEASAEVEGGARRGQR